MLIVVHDEHIVVAARVFLDAAFLAELDHESHFVFRICGVQGVLVGDLPGLIEIVQGLIESLHTLFARVFHKLLQLMDLAFTNEIGGERGVQENLHRRIATVAVGSANELLCDDRPKIQGQIHKQLRMHVLGKKVKDAVQRLVGIVGVQGTEAKVAGLGEGDRMLHRFTGPDFPDQNDVRRLPQGVPERHFVGLRIDADFTLGNDAARMRMHVFQWVFDGDDMAARMLVSVLDHGGQRRGFSRAGRADEQDQAAFGH